MTNTKPSWRDMPGATDVEQMAEFRRRYPPDPERLAAFEASSKRLMAGIVENLDNDFKDNEAMSEQNVIPLQNEVTTMEPSRPEKPTPSNEISPEFAERIRRGAESRVEISVALCWNINENIAKEHPILPEVKNTRMRTEQIELDLSMSPKPPRQSALDSMAIHPLKSMMNIQRLNLAIQIAANAHKDQLRKGTKTPYISHPYAVGMLLAQSGCSEDAVIAGILHDTVEDTALTLDDIRMQFGDKVAEIVAGCSEHDKELEWKERKQHTIDYLALASQEIKLVTCADKLHNVTCMLTIMLTVFRTGS
ncbi:MAG: HD domain-containing protein [Desulfuromonadaceae bacterium]|nr:HD domain-containing protein [Desulfuromonadaceae bacterium]